MFDWVSVVETGRKIAGLDPCAASDPDLLAGFPIDLGGSGESSPKAADRDRAGEKYERVRGRLVSLFRWRGCPVPEDLADRTFDRVARRLVQGAELRVADPYVYFHGVALNVLREYWRQPDRAPEAVDERTRASRVVENPDQAEHGDDRRLAERRLDCLTGCLKRLPEDQRRFIETYHAGSGSARIDARQALARQYAVPLNALRIRAYRIRTGLQDCVERCVHKTAT